jgi:hypothetical protein
MYKCTENYGYVDSKPCFGTLLINQYNRQRTCKSEDEYYCNIWHLDLMHMSKLYPDTRLIRQFALFHRESLGTRNMPSTFRFVAKRHMATQAKHMHVYGV